MPTLSIAISLVAAASLSTLPDAGAGDVPDAGQAPPVAVSAKALNAEGFALYQSQKWQEAADRFKAAFTADPKLAIAHYNFAATIFAAVQADPCAEPPYELEEALGHLVTSIRLDPKRRERMKVDPDFTGFRGSARYHAVLGADIHSKKGLTAAFPKMRFFAPSGHDHPFYWLHFRERGVLEVDDRDDAPKMRKGRWRIHERKADGGRKVLELEVDVPGTDELNPLRYRAPIHIGPIELRVAEPDAETFHPLLTDGWAWCCC